MMLKYVIAYIILGLALFIVISPQIIAGTFTLFGKLYIAGKFNVFTKSQAACFSKDIVGEPDFFTVNDPTYFKTYLGIAKLVLFNSAVFGC